MKKQLQQLAWFGAGLGTAVVLSVSYEVIHFVPVAVAFGMLCFLCGLLLYQFISSERRSKEIVRARIKLDEEKSKWEEKKDAWFSVKVARMFNENPDQPFDEMSKVAMGNPQMKLALDDARLAFHKSLLKMGEQEAARRGEKQLDRDLNQGGATPDENDRSN